MLHAWQMYLRDAPPPRNRHHHLFDKSSRGPHPKPSLASVSWMGGAYQDICEYLMMHVCVFT